MISTFFLISSNIRGVQKAPQYICSRKHLGIFLKYCVKILPIYPLRRGEISRNLSDICGKYYAEVISGPDRGLFYLTTLQLAHRVSPGTEMSLLLSTDLSHPQPRSPALRKFFKMDVN